MKRDLVIIEAPFNLGLKAKNEHHIPGVNKLPQWLHQFGFHGKLDTKKIIRPPTSALCPMLFALCLSHSAFPIQVPLSSVL